MRIERLSDSQMKFVLKHTDLEERDIKISELSHSSDKTKRLFKEIVRLAQDEGALENTPYLIEAMRFGVDSLSIVVTKINASDMDRYLAKTSQKNNQFTRTHMIFSFMDLDIAAAASEVIGPGFIGESQIYKLDGMYFLWVHPTTDDVYHDLEAVLLEFGQKHEASMLSKQYLAEYGEQIISENAIGKLCIYTANI